MFLVPAARLLCVPLAALAAVACAPKRAPVVEAPPVECSLTLEVEVPEGTGTLYAAGSVPALGMWNPNGLALEGSGSTRTARVEVPCGTTVEYKFTLGTWDTEALGDDGTTPPNHAALIDGAVAARHRIARFKGGIGALLDTINEAGVIGRVDVLREARSKYDILPRHVLIWLPPGYARSEARHPVLYMHDGQNALDPRMSFAGIDWGIDEAVSLLAASGSIYPPIVVAVFNSPERLLDYSPHDKGPLYARFLVEELKPFIDANYRTLPGPEHTATMGSSLGGLISLYLVREYPSTFGAGACLSAHLQFQDERYLKEIEKEGWFPAGARVYMDRGTMGIDSTYEPFHARLRSFLEGQGFTAGTDFDFLADEGADHNEAAWRARLARPLLFLYGARDAASTSTRSSLMSSTLSSAEFEAAIRERIAKVEADFNCRVGFSFKDRATGLAIEHRGHEIFHPASTMKVAVMIETVRQSEQGLFSLEDEQVVRQTFASMVDGTPFDAPPNEPLKKHLGSPVTIRFLVEEMIQISDNAATNMLIELCTPWKITATMRELGANDGKVIRPLEDELAFRAGLSNTMSPDDLTTLMEAIEQDRAASPAGCAEMRRILVGQRYRETIPAGIPAEATVGNKTGSITGRRHDTAFVQAPFGTYYITILLEGLRNEPGVGEAATKAAADLSHLIYASRARLAAEAK